MFKKWLLPVVVALAALAWTSPASADTILFDPDAGGALTAKPIDNLDWAVGNSLAILPAGTNAQTLAVGQSFTLLYQANLASATLSGGGVQFTQTNVGVLQTSPTVVISPVFYTVAAQFNETVLSKTVNADGTIDLSFGFNATPPNTFTIYQNTTGIGDNLSGVCFVCGTAVLNGSISPIAYTSAFKGQTTLPIGALDQAGANNYPGVFTLGGAGTFNINVAVSGVNSSIFSGLTPGSVITFGNFNGNTALPFEEADPSGCFQATAAIGCVGGQVGVPSVGTVNGVSTNRFVIQTDANSSFVTGASPIPEPASLTLLGFGLVGAAAARRRQKKNQK